MSTKEQELVPNARMTSSTSRPININCCLEIVFEKKQTYHSDMSKNKTLLKNYLSKTIIFLVKCCNFVIPLAQPENDCELVESLINQYLRAGRKEFICFWAFLVRNVL